MRSPVILLLVALAMPAADDQWTAVVQPVLRTYCQACHSGASPAGGFSISPLLALPEASALVQRDRLEQIARRLSANEMPPRGAPHPPPEQLAVVRRWIQASYSRLDQARPVDPGRVTARRLNRLEYSNSVRDLLGLDLNPGEALPPDPSGYGFDNIGDVLSVNSSLAEQYLKAAERIAQAAIPVPGEHRTPTMQRYLGERVGQDRQLHLSIDHVFPVEGEYTFRTAFYQALGNGTQTRLRLLLDGREVATDVLKFYYQIDRGLEAHGVKVAAGRHRIDASIEVLPQPSYKGQPPYLEYIQVYGPEKVVPAAESNAYKSFFTCGHAPGDHDASCARRILAPLARKAWRRPITPAELEPVLSLVRREERQTGSMEQALRTGLEAILVSPKFLFRIERDSVPGAHKLSGHELATRLSYFLWSSLPDDELSKLADNGKLSASLRPQIARMLQDAKSDAFVSSFAGQWLQTRNLTVVHPDPNLFPAFTGELAAAMRRETELFFAEVLKEDRPVLDFLDAPFTFLNEGLARHYGIPNITGDEFRKVALDGVQRGGVLSQASVLTVSSYPTRTSPVIRGKWVLENILNQPPPPPPPNVPPLDDQAGPSAGSVRRQLERHRANAVCAGCHTRMDPLGFGLENYDAIGRWRTRDGNSDIDASGTLPGGRSFTSPAELRQILKADGDTFTRALTEKLLTYALGRGVETADRATVNQIAGKVRDNGYRFRELIVGVVESDQFRMRRSETGQAGNK